MEEQRHIPPLNALDRADNLQDAGNFAFSTGILTAMLWQRKPLGAETKWVNSLLGFASITLGCLGVLSFGKALYFRQLSRQGHEDVKPCSFERGRREVADPADLVDHKDAISENHPWRNRLDTDRSVSQNAPKGRI